MKNRRPYRFHIEFLIAIFFFIGLENIMLPPLDKHDWRQTLTLSIAQNFLEHPNILYPRMDIGGKTDGIMACEFPIFNYLLAILFKVFGIHHWYGRLFNWSVSCIGLWFYYGLVKQSLNAKAAFFALLTMMGSLVFEYARKSMPDTFALFVTLAGVWSLWQYLENQSMRYLLSGFILIALGILSKIPFLLLLTFLILPVLDQQYSLIAKRNVVIAITVAMSCVFWWYYYWMPFLLEQYGNQLIWPVSLGEGWKIVMEQKANDSWSMLVGAPFHFKIPFLFSIMGLALILTGADTRLIWFALFYMALFLLFTLKTGIVFPTHEYYVIPLIPLLALFIGHFLDQLPWKPAFSLALAIILFASGFVYNKIQSYTPGYARSYLMTLPCILDHCTRKQDKIMVNNGAYNPTMMFWAKRKGWSVNQDVPSKTDWMPDFKQEGLKFVLLDLHLSKDSLPYTLVYEDENFRLYQL